MNWLVSILSWTPVIGYCMMPWDDDISPQKFFYHGGTLIVIAVIIAKLNPPVWPIS